MNTSLTWQIVITDDGTQHGAPITTDGWSVLSQLAAVRQAIPATWQAEAYPVIKPYATWEF
jgi:hypothetical protein